MLFICENQYESNDKPVDYCINVYPADTEATELIRKVNDSYDDSKFSKSEKPNLSVSFKWGDSFNKRDGYFIFFVAEKFPKVMCRQYNPANDKFKKLIDAINEGLGEREDSTADIIRSCISYYE